MSTLSAALFDITQAPLDLLETPFKIVPQRLNVFRASAEGNELWNRWEPISWNESANHQSITPETHVRVGIESGHRLLESIKDVMTRPIEVLELMAVRPLAHLSLHHR